MMNQKYELLPFYNNQVFSKKKNSLNTFVINNVKETIIEILRFCNVVLMQDCQNFEDFSGRDIDTFYISNTNFVNFKKNKDVILNQRDDGLYRFYINSKESLDFMTLDIENLSLFSPQTKNENLIHFNKATECNKTGLKHLESVAIIYYKLVKYFSQGIVFSYEQLFKLKNKINLLKPDDFEYLNNLISKYLPKEKIWIKKLIEYDAKDFEYDKEIKNFWFKKRFIRQNKRKVFAGKLELKNLIKSKKFIYALMFGSFAKWSKNHSPMPAIAIVGNDGAGKTTICERVIQDYHKLDPVFINMKSEVPLIPATKYLAGFMRKIINIQLIKNISLIKGFFSFMGQMIDIFDQYIKYRIGMAYADSGFGITIFERYITDKLRGEFPNINNKFLPLEQFFPLPDGFFYIDVDPKVTLERKKNDNHTLEEMTSKRENYKSLLNEFNEIKKTEIDNTFDENLKELKNYIFELAFKKKNQIKENLKIKRCIWKKNRNRKLAGNPADRFQKGSFL